MLAPAGPPLLPALLSATALALLCPGEVKATETSAPVKQAIQSGLPHYDPSANERARAAEKAARDVPSNRPAIVPGDSGNTSQADRSQQQTAGPGADVPSLASDNTLELPKITVHPIYDAPKHLPRIEPPPPGRDLKGEPLESGSARDDRLIRKHLPLLTQLLNSHAVQVALARAAEAAEQQAVQMDELAGAIELQQALGRDPAEIKKLRAEYLKLYYSGPK
jgi:hypothetical protein